MAANARLNPLGILRFNFFLTIQKCLDCALVFLGLIRIECVLDSAQRDMQGDAALFPTFDQSPIDRAKHEVLATPTDESVFDFREI